MASIGPDKSAYIRTMNRAILDATGLAKTDWKSVVGPKVDLGVKMKTLLDNAARASIGSELRATLDAAAKASKATSGMAETIEAATRGARLDGGLRQLLDSMEKQAAAIGLASNYATQIQVLSQPLAAPQLNRIIGVNPTAVAALREVLASKSTFSAHNQALAEVARQAGRGAAAASADLVDRVEQLSLATDAAAEVAPDLVGPQAAVELVQALVNDHRAFPPVALSDVDERIERGVGRALDARSPGKATAAAQNLLILVLGVAFDRVTPDQEDLLRLIVILVHYIRTF